MNESFAFVDNIPFSIKAGGSLSLPAGSWDYLYLASLTGGDLLAEGAGFRVPLILGRQIRVSKRETGSITITNRGSTEAVGVIYAGSGDVEDRGVVGAVEVTNFPGSTEWADNGESFFMFVYDGAVTGQYSHAQLFNPVGNTKKLIVNNVSAYQQSGGANWVVFERYSVPLSSLDLVYGEVNKKFGDVGISGAEARIQTQASLLSEDILRLSVAADKESLELQMDEPVVLSPGEGFMVRSASVNTAVGASFQYHTEDL